MGPYPHLLSQLAFLLEELRLHGYREADLDRGLRLLAARIPSFRYADLASSPDNGSFREFLFRLAVSIRPAARTQAPLLRNGITVPPDEEE